MALISGPDHYSLLDQIRSDIHTQKHIRKHLKR
eukprot:COSAG05_NODE_18290_length_310_cov_1.469194_1_plen_32_part_01